MFDFFKRPMNEMREFSTAAGTSVKGLLSGQVLTRDRIRAHYKLVLLIVFLFFCYIGNRYSCESKLAQIDQLQAKLVDVKFESLTRSSELLGMSKQSLVQQMLLTRDTSLHVSKVPPYKIKVE